MVEQSFIKRLTIILHSFNNRLQSFKNRVTILQQSFNNRVTFI